MMRLLAAALIVGATVAAQTTTTTPTTTTAKKPATAAKAATTAAKPATATASHRPAVSTRSLPLHADSKGTVGVAAIGTMPAAVGTPAPLFTLKYIDLKVGTGELAQPSTPPSNVVWYTVNYTGWTTDGKKFDSSVDRNEPIVFPIGMKRVISGWDAGFEGMRVGGKRRLIIPWQLAYGAAGRAPVIPEKADLVFDIELIGQGLTQDPVTGTKLTKPDVPAVPVAPATPPASQRPEEHQE